MDKGCPHPGDSYKANPWVQAQSEENPAITSKKVAKFIKYPYHCLIIGLVSDLYSVPRRFWGIFAGFYPEIKTLPDGNLTGLQPEILYFRMKTN